jgi:hypothetical protein
MGMNTATVQRLYVAYFNRPADPVSLAVYEAMLPTDRAATQAELLVVAETYFSPSAEYTANFTGKSNSQTVNTLYQNIFGRDAEAAGLIDWATKLTDGSITVAELALQLSYSAQGTDAAVVDARIEAATTFTNNLNTAEESTGYSGAAAAAQGKTYLAQISGALPTTVEAIGTEKDTAVTNVDASITAAVDAGNAVAGESSTLTAGQDTIVGTAGNDSVSAVVLGAGVTGTTINAGDQLAMAAGTDTLNVAFSGDGGNAAGIGYNVAGVQATDLTKILLSNFDTNAGGVTQFDTTLMPGVTTVGFSSSGADGDTNFTGMNTLVSAEMKNGSADLTLTHGAAATAGASSISLDVQGQTAGTFTAAGIETLAVNSNTVASSLTAVTATSLTNLNVSGNANLTIGTAIDFVDNATATAVDGTLDASGLSGALTVGFNTGDNVTVTGGTAADSFQFTTGFSVRDTVDGGDDRDTLQVSTANATDLTATTLANVSNVEILSVTSTNDAASYTGTGVTGFDTIKVESNVKTYQLTAPVNNTAIAFTLNGAALTTAATDANATNAEGATLVAGVINALAGFSATAAGDTVTITALTGDAVEISVPTGGNTAATIGAYTNMGATGITDQTIEISSGNNVTVAMADASGGSDSLTINLTSPTADAGFSQTINQISVSDVETLNLNTSGLTASTSDYIVTTLTDGGTTALTTLNITGSSSLDLQGTITALDLVTVDASTFTGDLILDGVAENQTITGGTGGDSFIMAANLNASDTIDGGDGTDALSATVTGLTATTGALNIADVEAVNLTNAGTAAIDAAAITGAGEIAVLTNTTSMTLTNLAAGTAVGLGVNNTDGAVTGIVSAALADATGSEDALTFNLNDTATANNNAVDVRVSGVETVTFDVTDATDTSNADYTLDVDALNATSVIISGSEADAGQTTTLTALDTETSSVTATAYAGILTTAAAATTATTFNVAGDRTHNLTGSGVNDTFTVGATTNAAITIDGGAGTADVLNITFGNGTQTTQNISNVETINITVSGSADIDLDAANQLTGINAANSINFSGGNSLSSIILGAAAEEMRGNTNAIIDYSAYTGTTSTFWTLDEFDNSESALITTQVIGTSGIGDSVTVDYNAGNDATVQLNTQGVETINLDMANSGTELDVDMSLVTGATLMNITDDSSESIELSSLAEGVTVDVSSDAAADTTVEIQRAVVTGTETQSVNVTAIGADDGVAIVMADVETLVVTPESANQVDLNLASLSMTAAGATMAVNFAGANDVELTGLGADVTTLDASAMLTGGAVVQTARAATAASTYTGSTGGDTFMMLNAGDVIDAGAGTDTLDIDMTAILGGVSVDLSATGEQISTMNGAATSGTVSNFENVDVSGYSGFGAVVTGSSTANTITGTASADQINSGGGADTIVATAGNDAINMGSGADTIQFTSAQIAAASGTTATFAGGSETDILQVVDATTVLVDADLARVTSVETITLFDGTNSIALGANAVTSGVTTVNGAATAADTIALTVAAAANLTGLNVGTTAAVNNVSLSDAAAADLSSLDVTGHIDTLTGGADAGADIITIKQSFFDSGAGTTASAITLTGAGDGDNDQIILKNGATAWEGAAEANAGDVDIAGEYFISNATNNGVITYFNEAGATVVTLTITGLDAGAVAIVGGDLVFTA